MPVNDEIYNRIILSRAGLVQYEHRTARRIRSLFREVEGEIRGMLIDWPMDPERMAMYLPQRRAATYATLMEYFNGANTGSMAIIRESMMEAARREGRDLYFALDGEVPGELRRLGVSFTEIPAEALLTILDQPVLGDFTQSLVGYQGKFTRDVASAVDKALGASLIYGEGVPAISRRLRDIVGRSGLAMEMFSRTAIQTAGARAQDMFYRANQRVIKSRVYTATFDIRTCPVCAGYDGREFPIGRGPVIPVHVGCRCTYTPRTKSWKEMGFKVADIRPGTRATMDGAIPKTVSLQTFLRQKARDPVWGPRLQKTWGVGRTKMFAQGKVNLADMAVRVPGRERIRPLGQLKAAARRRRRRAG